jgi:hypothetical protein
MDIRVIRIDQHVGKVKKILKVASERIERTFDESSKKPKRRLISIGAKKWLFKIGASLVALFFAFCPVILGWWVWGAVGPEGFWQGLALFFVTAIVLFYPVILTMIVGIGFIVIIWGE